MTLTLEQARKIAAQHDRQARQTVHGIEIECPVLDTRTGEIETEWLPGNTHAEIRDALDY